jgi:uncharacterized protein
MKYKNIGSWSILRIDRGEEIVESIKHFCMDQEIKLGTIQGIGAVEKIVIGMFDTRDKKFHSAELIGDFEITALIGNITTKDADIYLHIHATFSDTSYNAFGGHLSSAVVSGTCEVIISRIKGTMNRKFDNHVGLNLFDL